jgi:coenzyme F420-0:L-glutamate ligase/coenzyme F420-1:gamma-L-glutamate ligase
MAEVAEASLSSEKEVVTWSVRHGEAINLLAIPNVPHVAPGDDLATIIITAVEHSAIEVSDGDIFVIAQKIVSKAEDRYVELRTVTPSSRAIELAEAVQKDPRLVEVILTESTEVVRFAPGVLIVAHRSGCVMANAGVDASNLEPDVYAGERVLLLPLDADATCVRLRKRLGSHFNCRIGVIINDSVGRPWRNGSVGLALGVSGPPAVWDRIGQDDLYGRTLQVTQIGFADQISAAAALVMGEGSEGIPVVKVGNLFWESSETNGRELLRDKERDLFR